MKEENEKPMTDEQLSAVLKKWSVAAPDDLESKIFGPQQHKNWWRFLLTGSIRVPVPVLCGLAVLMVIAVWRTATASIACTAENVRPVVTSPVTPVNSMGACPANSKC